MGCFGFYLSFIIAPVVLHLPFSLSEIATFNSIGLYAIIIFFSFLLFFTVFTGCLLCVCFFSASLHHSRSFRENIQVLV